MRIRISTSGDFSGSRGYSHALSRRARWACGIAAVLALGAVAFCGSLLLAKEKKISRTVSGAVLDNSDNGIPGAAVHLTDLQTGKKVAAYSGDGGHYQFSDLQPSHDYEVQASYRGSSSEVRKVSSVDTRNRIVINLTIPATKE